MRRFIIASVLLQSALCFAATAKIEFMTYIFVNVEFKDVEKKMPGFEEDFFKRFQLLVVQKIPELVAVDVTNLSTNNKIQYRVNIADIQEVKTVRSIFSEANEAMENEIYQNAFKYKEILKTIMK